jgi:Mg/Co/Ni transporter MgtE
MEELPDDDRVQILTRLTADRAADVLEAMQPDDATDLLGVLPEEMAEELLQLMEPDEAAPIRRLMAYDENTAGGMMTTDPVILGPEASIAEALAVVRREEISPALASLVYVCRPPLETPTGRLLGIVHIQKLLREPPHQPLGTVLDKAVEPVAAVATLEQVTRQLAAYNLVALPVTDTEGRLLGAVTVDDVLDHMLPEDWREERDSPDVIDPRVDAEARDVH